MDQPHPAPQAAEQTAQAQTVSESAAPKVVMLAPGLSATATSDTATSDTETDSEAEPDPDGEE
jgi:hypothetical protein